MTEWRHQELTGAIIGVYYDVYNGMGRTYPEYIYERAMMDDLQRKGIKCRQQPKYKIFYRDRLIGVQRLDLFVAGQVVVELKVAPNLTKLHKAQTISYLKVVGKEDGLVCNFGNPRPEFGRVYLRSPSTDNDPEASQEPQADWPANFLAPELTHEVIGGLYEVHSRLGPGFIHRIYAKATYHELALRGLEVLARKEYQVIYRGRSVGEIKFNHLQIGNTLMVFPVAIQDINDISINNLKAWMVTQNIPLSIIANFYPTRLKFKVLRI